MKNLLLAALLLAFSTGAHAVVRPVVVADSTVGTVPGIGGYTEVSYTFAKGDKVTLAATSSKLLERAMVIMMPQTVLLRIKGTKKVNETFEVPKDGTVIIRFVSDRGGINNIHYNLIRLPASEDLQDFSTKLGEQTKQ